MRPGRLPLLMPLLIALAALGAASCGDDDGDRTTNGTATPVQPTGTYVYETTGAERIGGSLPGSHRYGPRSEIVVDRSGCELGERWDATPERWAEWRYCVTGDTWRLESVTDHHEFFGRIEEYEYRCSGRRVPRPAQVSEGFRWTDRCRARRISTVARGEVVAVGPLRVAGTRVTAVHLKVTATFRGRVRGASVMDSWLRRSDGLLLRRTFASDTRARTVIGVVPARERYTLALRKLQPDT